MHSFWWYYLTRELHYREHRLLDWRKSWHVMFLCDQWQSISAYSRDLNLESWSTYFQSVIIIFFYLWIPSSISKEIAYQIKMRYSYIITINGVLEFSNVTNFCMATLSQIWWLQKWNWNYHTNNHLDMLAVEYCYQ